MELILLILAAVIPAGVLLYFIYRKDKYKQEPVGQLLKGFGYGLVSALAATLLAALLLLMGLYSEEADTVGGFICTSLFGAAIPEELAKFFFLWLLLRNNKYFDEYFDGIVYAACIGLGFASFENIFYLIENYEDWVATGIARAFVSIPGHFMFAVTMGFYYSKAFLGGMTQKKKYLSLAILIPILLHAAFDATLLISQILAGSIALFYILFFFLIRKSKQFAHEHLKTDEKLLGISEKINSIEE